MGDLTFRAMTPADLNAILDIENICFDAPWSAQSFQNELEKDYGEIVVAEIKGKIVGYLVAWRVVDEIHIANVAVHPDYRRRGIGRQLVQRAITSRPGFEWAGLEVRASNQEALTLYIQMGFTKVGVREKYYPGGEDAILLAKWLEEDW